MEELTTYRNYQEYKAALSAELEKTAESFVRIGYMLKLAVDTDILKESGYRNVVEFAKAEYGIDKTLVSRFISINDRFSENGYSDRLKEQYRGFGYAKLSLMLQLPEEINEELSPGYSKSEVQAIKEEVEAEKKISDIELLIEGEDKGQQELNNLQKAVRQLGKDNPELYRTLHGLIRKNASMAAIQEALAPAGESIYSIRIPGIGRMMLTIKEIEREIPIINIRTNEKELFTWNQLRAALELMINPDLPADESWSAFYGEPFTKEEEPPASREMPKKEEKQEKQQRKISKVVKAPEKKKLEPVKWEPKKWEPKQSETQVKTGAELPEEKAEVAPVQQGEAKSEEPIAATEDIGTEKQMEIEDYPEALPEEYIKCHDGSEVMTPEITRYEALKQAETVKEMAEILQEIDDRDWENWLQEPSK